MYKIAGELTPKVFHIAARSLLLEMGNTIVPMGVEDDVDAKKRLLILALF